MAAVRRVVLHVAQSVETGVAHVVAEHVAAQVRSGWRVVLACPGGRLAELARSAGAEVLAWQAGRQPGPSVVAEAHALADLVARTDPDVVHLHSAKAGLVGRLVVRGRRSTVFTPHAWSWQAVKGPMAVAARSWERFGARWTDVTVCLSSGEVREAREAGVRTTLALVPNDVPIEWLRRTAPPTRESARDILGLAPGAPVAVCCARLAAQKGQDVLLRAWPEVLEVVPDAELALVGDGPDRAALEAAAHGLPGVTFVGMTDRVEALHWLKAATVVACPSRYEGMSLVPLEAAVLGVPVVASDVEGMGEGCGASVHRLVPPGDPAALAEALAGLLGNTTRADRLGQLAAATVDRAEGPSSVAQMLKIYRDLLGEGRMETAGVAS